MTLTLTLFTQERGDWRLAQSKRSQCSAVGEVRLWMIVMMKLSSHIMQIVN